MKQQGAESKCLVKVGSFISSSKSAGGGEGGLGILQREREQSTKDWERFVPRPPPLPSEWSGLAKIGALMEQGTVLKFLGWTNNCDKQAWGWGGGLITPCFVNVPAWVPTTPGWEDEGH